MRKSALLLLPSLLLLAAPSAQAGKDEPVDCVRLARTWDDAVSEAKLLNVPIVVHSHGFYCGPCWGMHSAVMCNKKYIEFAGQNTVEVISLGRLQEGIDADDRKAGTYETMRDGEQTECMIEFPGLTRDEVLALGSGKAASYNDTGKIPFTCLVNPHTLAEIERWNGGTSAKTIMEAVSTASKQLVEEHGEGFSRKAWNKVLETVEDAWGKVAKEDFAAAVALIDTQAQKGEGWPESVLERLQATRRRIVQRAEALLADIETQGKDDPRRAKRDLQKLSRKLKGTGLEERAATLFETLSAAS